MTAAYHDPSDIARLADAVRRKDRQALAQAITLVESAHQDRQREALALLAYLGPASADTYTIGITGAPGVGKSSLIERLGLHMIATGKARVAVLAIDPTSPVAGGSILGDKTRMPELSANPAAFVRPSPSGGTLGGLGERSPETVRLLAHAGFDRILLETVGVGQSEVAIAGLADITLLLVQPGGGDELQGIKKGIMEIADVVAVTKMDGAQASLARHAVADCRQALAFRTQDIIPVLGISSLTGEGIPDLHQSLEERLTSFAATGTLNIRKSKRQTAWFQARALESAQRALLESEKFQALRGKVSAGKVDPLEAIREMEAPWVAPSR